MQTRFYALLLSCLVALSASAQSVDYSTPTPHVEDVNDRDVVINRIDLTAKYTIIYMRFRDGEEQQPDPSRRLRIPGIPYPIPDRIDPSGGHTIQFVPTARLYANGGARSFKFIKADNIPTAKRRGVRPGEQVDFVAYFERLDPGIEVFDLFECSDRNRPGETCFNFWGVHVINPLKRQPSARQSSPVPPVKPRPAPAPVPKTPPPPEPKPTPPADVLAIKGVVRDAKTGKPVAAMLTYRLLSGPESGGDEAADSLQAQAGDGAYRIPGNALTVWDVTVSARGYFGQRDTIAITRTEKTVNFDLVPIVLGAKITLHNIYFAQSKYDLQAESYPELDRLVTVMQQNPTMTIKLEGHTDIIGDFDANLELSRNRVQAVKRYLLTKGIATARVEAMGYGHSRPINSTPGKPHPENRRVEMVITKV